MRPTTIWRFALIPAFILPLLTVPAAAPVTAQDSPSCTVETAWPEALKPPRPAPDLVPELAMLLGGWEGRWDGTLPTRLVVEEISSTRATVVYAWGDHPSGQFAAGWSRYMAQVLPGGVLDWEAGPHWRFTPGGGSTSLEGEYTLRGETSRVSMTRCSAVAAVEVPDLSGSPAVGARVFENGLAEPGALRRSQCPTGLSLREFVGEGHMFKIRGRCTANAMNAAIAAPLDGLTIPDAETSVDVRTVGGLERARIRIGFRLQPDPGLGVGYAAILEPGRGAVGIVKQVGPQGPSTTLAVRTDLAADIANDGWQNVTVRTAGPRLWLLLNDRPILAAFDTTFDSGGLVFVVIRLGSLDDETETAAVFKDLRISALADGDPSRAPTYRQP